MDSKKNTQITNDKCGSLWFNRFMIGLKTRMGGLWKQNKALSVVIPPLPPTWVVTTYIQILPSFVLRHMI